MTTSASRPATKRGERLPSSRGTPQHETTRMFRISVLLSGGVAMMAALAIAWSSATPPMTTVADQAERASTAPGDVSGLRGEPNEASAAMRADQAPAEPPLPALLRAEQPRSTSAEDARFPTSSDPPLPEEPPWTPDQPAPDQPGEAQAPTSWNHPTTAATE